MIDSRSAADQRVRGNVIRYSALRRDDRVIADLAMSNYADLASENHSSADLRRTSKTYLRAEQSIFADLRSVADLDEVVDFHSAANAGFAYAGAMQAGSPIGTAIPFYGSNRVPMAMEGLALPWDNVRDRYLGLLFEIQGKNHFGWARLSVQFSSRQNTWRAQLTGYAYETVADRPIKAGQIQEQGDAAAGLNVPAPDPAQIASLGGLALGADGIALWRREESESGSRVA